MRILVTGGAGFVGSNLALMLKRDLPDVGVCAFDNLRRRGSELALGRLRNGGVEFLHGDVRCPDDLADAGGFDLLLECSAEPSVQAGYESNPAYVIQTNLAGTVHCLEAARKQRADVIFLSTSRVYPIERLRGLPLERRQDRFDLAAASSGQGWSFDGIGMDFPLSGRRSLYGATKLAAELLVEEYRAMYGLRTIINRCGVISGPWQMGKVDQGFTVLWAARHLFGGPLGYAGFGGDGLQVRDVLHVADLSELIRLQIADLSRLDGGLFNVGGGRERSLSLVELTRMCRERAGLSTPGIPITRDPETNPADVPFYVTDNFQIATATGWEPRRGLDVLLDDIFSWLREHRGMLEPILGGPPAETAAPGQAGSRYHS
jgi:CDP-paratose 2-epimerase